MLVRKSNIELLRIIAMLLIILHHSFLQSGIVDIIRESPINFNTFLMSSLSIGGKVGVNIFFIITGYFMISSKTKIIKIIKLSLELIFYAILTTLIFSVIDPSISNNIFHAIFRCFVDIRYGFIGTWVMVYLVSSFTNELCYSLSQKRFIILFTFLGIYFSVLSIGGDEYMYSYFSWGIVMYLVGAYIRLYPPKGKSYFYIIGLLFGIIWLVSVYFSSTVIPHFYRWLLIYSLHPNMIPFVITSISLFILFTRLKISSSKIINDLAAGAFAVYICHDAIDYSRSIVWNKIINMQSIFREDFGVIYVILYALALYLVIAFIDLFRRRLIEKPFFKFLDCRMPFLNFSY